jgi:20S proteasome alpha/beta subunit
MHAYTLYGFVRPFGCYILLAAFESDGPQLYGVEPSGVTYVRGFFLLKTKREFMVYFRVIMVLLLAKHNKRLKLN